jgi:Ca2+-binding EF-hand superfamily protein
MVAKAFAMMDKNGSGTITVEDVISIYDVSKNPDFIEKRLTKEQILGNFINSFEGPRANRDGVITFAEFIEYYTDLSMSIPTDDYFVGMMESTW